MNGRGSTGYCASSTTTSSDWSFCQHRMSYLILVLKHGRAHVFRGFWSRERTLRVASNITCLIIFLKFLFHPQDFGRDNTAVIFTTEWNYLTGAHMRITDVIHVRNHTLPPRKLHLRNNTTIVVIQLTQSSKQEHNELTGAKPGITSKQARPVTTHLSTRRGTCNCSSPTTHHGSTSTSQPSTTSSCVRLGTEQRQQGTGLVNSRWYQIVLQGDRSA